MRVVAALLLAIVFVSAPAVAAQMVAPIDKAPQILSPRYLAAVRELPCAFCPGQELATTAHHVEVIGRKQVRNDLSAVPACGDGTRGCHGLAQTYQIPRARQDQAVAETQTRLLRQRAALWWLGVMREIAGNLEK